MFGYDAYPKEWTCKAISLQKYIIALIRIRMAFIASHFDIQQNVGHIERRIN